MRAAAALRRLMPVGLMPVGLILLGPILAACTPAPRPELPHNDPPTAADDCGATGLQGLVGRPEAVLAGLRSGQPLRILHPGQAVTMEYSAARLTIEIDATGRIARLSCG